MLYLRIDVTGINEMIRAVQDWEASVNDLSDVWPDVRDEFYAIEQEQFDAEGQGMAGGWAPLSPAYATWKEKHYGTLPILQRSGVLMESLTSEGAGGYSDIQPMGLTVGTTVAYAIYHQEGTGRMPARPVIDMTPATMTRMSRIIQDYLRERTRNAFDGLADVAGGGG